MCCCFFVFMCACTRYAQPRDHGWHSRALDAVVCYHQNHGTDVCFVAFLRSWASSLFFCEWVLWLPRVLMIWILFTFGLGLTAEVLPSCWSWLFPMCVLGWDHFISEDCRLLLLLTAASGFCSSLWRFVGVVGFMHSTSNGCSLSQVGFVFCLLCM